MQRFKIIGQSCNRYRVKTHTQVLKFFGSESFTLHGYGSIKTEVRWLSQNRNISVLANDIELTVIVSVKQLTNNQLFKSLLWRTYVSLDQTVVATRPTCPALPYDKLQTNHRVTHSTTTRVLILHRQGTTLFALSTHVGRQRASVYTTSTSPAVSDDVVIVSQYGI